MLEPGQDVPHFEVTALDGRPVRYGDVWQRRHLLLIALGPSDDPAGRAYADRLERARADLSAHDTAVVITADAVAGVPVPGILIADRWGEIQHVEQGRPEPDALADWLRFVQQQCPECQGETR
jgi:hypothetical protein